MLPSSLRRPLYQKLYLKLLLRTPESSPSLTLPLLMWHDQKTLLPFLKVACKANWVTQKICRFSIFISMKKQGQYHISRGHDLQGVPTSSIKWFAKKCLKIPKGEKLVKVCLHFSLEVISLQFDEYFCLKEFRKGIWQKMFENHKRRKNSWKFVYILAKQCRSHFNLTNFLTKFSKFWFRRNLKFSPSKTCWDTL